MKSKNNKSQLNIADYQLLDQNDIKISDGGAISCFCLLFPPTHLAFVWGISGLGLLNISITNCNTVTAAAYICLVMKLFQMIQNNLHILSSRNIIKVIGR